MVEGRTASEGENKNSTEDVLEETGEGVEDINAVEVDGVSNTGKASDEDKGVNKPDEDKTTDEGEVVGETDRSASEIRDEVARETVLDGKMGAS